MKRIVAFLSAALAVANACHIFDSAIEPHPFRIHCIEVIGLTETGARYYPSRNMDTYYIPRGHRATIRCAASLEADDISLVFQHGLNETVPSPSRAYRYLRGRSGLRVFWMVTYMNETWDGKYTCSADIGDYFLGNSLDTVAMRTVVQKTFYLSTSEREDDATLARHFHVKDVTLWGANVIRPAGQEFFWYEAPYNWTLPNVNGVFSFAPSEPGYYIYRISCHSSGGWTTPVLSLWQEVVDGNSTTWERLKRVPFNFLTYGGSVNATVSGRYKCQATTAPRPYSPAYVNMRAVHEYHFYLNITEFDAPSYPCPPRLAQCPRA